MKTLKNVLAAALMLAALHTASAQRFEGSIGFTKTIGPVTADYVYYVKDNMIRVEELDDKGGLQGIMLVNTEDNSVVALSPERKMYIDVPNRRRVKETDIDVKQTGKKEMINGYECSEWVVDSSEDGRQVSYWVAENDFDFFIPMLKTLNRKDKMALYYINLPQADGSFPMRGRETKTDGVELTRLEVTKIEKNALEANMFEIPEGYSKFERESN